MPDLTPHEEYALLMGDCSQCGATHGEDWSEAQCVESLATNAALKAQSPKMYALTSKLIPLVLCDRCVAARESASSERLRKMHVDAVWRNTYGTELMPKASRHQNFAESKSAIEERNAKAWEWAHSWKPSSGNAWIFGLEGRGKTYFARCIAMAELKKGFTVAEISAIRWCEKAGDWKWQERRDKLARVHLLIFEDIDKGGWREKSFEAFWELVNIRCEGERHILITSNGAPEYMIGKVSEGKEGVWARIQGNSSMTHTLAKRLMPCTRWELTGESLRRAE